MRKLIALSYIFIVLGCIAHAQLPLTGAGKGSPGGGGGGGYTGPGDIVAGAYFWGGMRAYSSATRGTRAINICNGVVANCVDVNSDAVTGKVTITSSTVAGTDCTAFVGACVINILYDQSGNGRNILTLVSPNGAANPPGADVFCTTRSQPCMAFATANNQAFGTASLTLSQPYSVSFWNQNTNTGVRQDYIYSDPTGTCGTAQTIVAYNVGAVANQIDAFAGTGSLVTVSDGAWHGIGVLFSNGAPTGGVSVDGAAVTGGNTGANALAAKVLVIGMNCDVTSNKWNGFLSEIGAWAGDISANFAAINTNQAGFY